MSRISTKNDGYSHAALLDADMAGAYAVGDGPDKGTGGCDNNTCIAVDPLPNMPEAEGEDFGVADHALDPALV